MIKPKREARGICQVEGCGEVDCGQAGYCLLHATRLRRHGDPLIVLPRGNPAGPAHPDWMDAGFGYTAAHRHVTVLRGGPASCFPCVDCDEPAAHWSYDHQDPDEQRDPRCGPFSEKPDHYEARCVSCHKRFDLAMSATRRAS